MHAPAPVPGGKLDGFRASGLAAIISPPLSTSRGLHYHARRPSGVTAHYTLGQMIIDYSAGCTAAQELRLKPSYRYPGHSGWTAYAPVDLPTPSSSGLAAPRVRARHWFRP
jgi:hypothetical protein